MELELDEELGRNRCQRAGASNTTPNYCIGTHSRILSNCL